MLNNFVHLHLHTEYSLLDGVGKISSYIERAKELGMKSIAITDHGNLFGALEFYKKAEKEGIKPIIGIEAYVSEFSMSEKNGKNFHLVLLAKNLKGYKNLMKLSSESYIKGFYRRPRVDKELLGKYSEGIIALSSCINGEVATRILEEDDEAALKAIREYEDIFSKENFYLEVQSNEIPEQKIVNEKLYNFSELHNFNLVATNDVHYVYEGEHKLQDIVICIQTGAKISDEKRMRIGSKELFLKSKEQMIESLGEKYLTAINNTNKIASECNLDIKFGEFQFPSYELPENIESLEDYLRKLTYEGLNKIYKLGLNEEIITRADYELSIINEMGYAAYFIVVWDFIDFARSKNIAIGPGRGSAAGSLVSYALGITKVDPLKYNLIFERFLNPERISMPDIDIDICQERRHEVIEYVVAKYGSERVAQIITFGTMKARAAIRDIGRVYNIPLIKVDKLAKLIPFNATIASSLREIEEVKKLYSEDRDIQNLIDTAAKLENKVRHSSVHAAGIVITKEELTETVPLYLDNKNSVVCTQYQMKALEDLGLLKMDFLGLKNLTNLQKTVENIEKDLGEKIDLYSIPLNNKKVYELLSKGDTTGIFQMESEGMRKILKKLKPDVFEDIVALLSLYRPGPLGSGMVDDFINCKNGLSEIKYPHPSLEAILKETYGVILYQEQVMKIANVMANYSLGEADLLRRAMGKKNIYIMQENREKFVERAVKNNYTEEKANEIFELIDKFAGYGFNKSHSAAYALITYWTAYFKANYIKHYYAALLSSDMSHTDNVAFYFEDAKKHNLTIYSPDVNKASPNFSVEKDGINFALTAIKNVGESMVVKIVEECKLNGKYLDYESFVLRTRKHGLNKKSLEALIYAGALDSIDGNRHQKIEAMDKVLDYANKISKEDDIQQMNLFGEARHILTRFTMPELSEYGMSDMLEKEREFLGFYLSGNPLDKYQKIAEVFSLSRISSLYNKNSVEKVRTYGMIRELKKTTTKKGEMMCFFTLDAYNEAISTVVFPSTYNSSINSLLERKLVYVEGNIQTDYFKNEETKKLIVKKILPLEELKRVQKKVIFIRVSVNDRDKISQLRNILRKYPGDTMVKLVISDSGEKKIKDINLKVNANSLFLKEIGELMAYDNIRIKI